MDLQVAWDTVLYLEISVDLPITWYKVVSDFDSGTFTLNFYIPYSEMVSVVSSSHKICCKAPSFLTELFSHKVVSIK